MTRITFYRKYRSSTFDEIIGQEHIIQTLKNAISFNRLSHAYIFSGPRGTGKTSIARILAKSINCRKGMSATPCLSCDLCEKITKGNSVDVIEIDAASNTGVDNIRTLNEQINFTPVECLYKIYIIDEVHMLSTGAFNALLKTLEEPPAYTLFILATTEPQKIPATIHSRCQRLHFRRLTTSELITQLRIIATNEAIEITDKSLHIIAKNANGGMRDAISLFDQIYSFKGKEITEEDVLLILGTANWDRLYELMSYFFDQDVKSTLSLLQKMIDEGIHITQFITDILSILQQLVMIQLNLDQQVDLNESNLQKLKGLSQKVNFDSLKSVVEQFAKLEAEVRWFPNPELLLSVKFLAFMNPVPVQNSVAPIVEQALSPAKSPIVKPNPVATPEPITEKQIPIEAPKPIPQASTPSDNPDLLWSQLLNTIKESKRLLYSMLEHSKIVFHSSDKLTVRIRDLQFKDFILKDKALIESHIQSLFQKSLVFEIEIPKSIPAEPISALQSDKLFSSSTSSATLTQVDPSNELPKIKQINQIVALFEGSVL